MKRNFRRLEKAVRVVPEVKSLAQELVAIGQIEGAEGKVLIDTGAQASLIKRDASTAPMAKPDVILRGISGRILKVYGQQEVSILLKPGVPVPGTYIVSNLPKGYLAVLGCDILQNGAGEIDVEKGLLRLFGKEIWLNRLTKGESVPDPRREPRVLNHSKGSALGSPSISRSRQTLNTSEREPFVYCPGNVTLPSRCEKRIQVKLSKFGPSAHHLEGKDVVVEPLSLSIHGVYLARTLAKVENNRCWVKVVNISDEELAIPKNAKLGLLDSDLTLAGEPEHPRRKVLIVADSHGRGLQEILSERLPKDLELEVHFMPNGKLKHVMSELTVELPKLSNRDLVIVIGGTNDVEKFAPYPLTLQQAFSSLPESWEAKMIIVPIFDRHDVNLKNELREANLLMDAMVHNVTIRSRGSITRCEIDGSWSRKFYTRHGLHLNDQGKLHFANILRGLILEGHSPPCARIGRVEKVPEAEFEACLDEKLNHLSCDAKAQVKSTLMAYKGVFAHCDTQPLGCTSAVKHVIRTGDAAPVYKRAYRVPVHQKGTLDALIQDQLDKGVIVPSHSEWASPVVVVPKKSPDGTPKYRFCVDYRAVNAITTPDVYPLPNITETLDSLGGCQMFTTLDLRSGYHQIQMDEDSRAKTAFNVPGGHYEYQRMPFGLSTAPATFQRLMDSVLMGLKGEKCLVYLDDIILYTRDLPSHLVALKEVLDKLQGVNLSVQLSKCHFVVEEVNYLGHVITKRGVEPDPGKISAVRDFPVPKAARDVRSFLGLAGYYRRFVDGFSTIAKPLFDLTKQGREYEWTPSCQEAFDQLKQALISAPVLVYPDFEKPFILATDASNHCLGAVLSQEIDGQEHPVAYCSRTLFPAEKNYSTTELELLSVVWSTKYFRCYLLGRPFRLVTDHAALKWMLSLKDPSSRLMRWSLRLAEFNYAVEHKPGKRHTNADGLSRAMCAVVRRDELPVIDLATIREHQNKDLHCQDLKKAKSFKVSPEKILYRDSRGNRTIVVPTTLTREVIRLNHDLPTAGHAGVAKTLERVKAKFWWKGMEKDVLDYVRTCKSCSQRTDYGRVKAPLGSVFNEPKTPFEVIAADIVGPLPTSGHGNVYILSVMDHFTRYCEFVPLPDQTAESIARGIVQRVITKFGVPKFLISDQGASFTSDLIRQLCKFLHVRKLQTTGFHPQANGRLERVHATIARMLSHFVNRHQTDWDEYLPYITMAYNSQGHEATGFSPYEMVFGRKMEVPLEADLTITEEDDIYNDHVETLREKLRETFDLAARRKVMARRKNERSYNRKAKTVEYREGQMVLLHVPSIGRHRVKKLSKLWKGPFKIIKVPSPLTVVLKIRKRDVPVHVNRIKPYMSRGPVPTHQVAEPDVESEVDESEGDPVVHGPEPSAEPPSRRLRRRPAHLHDYVE